VHIRKRVSNLLKSILRTTIRSPQAVCTHFFVGYCGAYACLSDRENCTVFVANLPADCEEQELKGLFKDVCTPCCR
jgi:hypothetical protein